MAKTLLAVHAHPDDETITMGGTLGPYSAEGVRTIVVTCTRGDLGEVRALREVGIDAPGSAPAGADAGPDVPEIGTDDSLVTTRIDVRSYVGIKRAALPCHKTQMSGDHFLTRMPDALAQRLWAYEYFSQEDTSSPADEDAAERPSR